MNLWIFFSRFVLQVVCYVQDYGDVAFSNYLSQLHGFDKHFRVSHSSFLQYVIQKFNTFQHSLGYVEQVPSRSGVKSACQDGAWAVIKANRLIGWPSRPKRKIEDRPTKEGPKMAVPTSNCLGTQDGAISQISLGLYPLVGYALLLSHSSTNYVSRTMRSLKLIVICTPFCSSEVLAWSRTPPLLWCLNLVKPCAIPSPESPTSYPNILPEVRWPASKQEPKL